MWNWRTPSLSASAMYGMAVAKSGPASNGRFTGLRMSVPRSASSDLLGDLGRDVALGLSRRGSEMGSVHDVGQSDERVVGVRRLGPVDVDAGGSHLAGGQRLGQGGLVDEGAAGGVDDHDAVLHRWRSTRPRSCCRWRATTGRGG